MEIPNGDVVNASGFTGASSNFKIVEDSGSWYGFGVSRSDEIYRLAFGSDPTNLNPASSVVQGIGGFTNSPEDIDFVKVGVTWIAVISNLNSSDLTIVDFSSGLGEDPTSVYNLTITGITVTQASGIRIVEEMGNYTAILANRGQNSVIVIDLGTDLSSIISAQEISVTGSNSLRDITIVRECSDWHLYTLSLGNNAIHHLTFSGTITAVPNQATLTVSGDPFVNPRTIVCIQEGLDYFLLLSSAGGEFYRVALGDNLLLPNVTSTDLTDLGVFGNMLGFDIVRGDGSIIGYGIGSTDQILYQLRLEKDCNVSIETSTDSIPSGIRFSSSGDYEVQLRTISDAGEHTSVQQITITSDMAPDVDFMIDNSRCITNANTFSAIPSSGLNYSWNFNGEGSDTNGISNFQFPTVGEKNVQLVVNDGTCNNMVSKSIDIYVEPSSPDFDFSGTSLCTNSQITFSNLTDETGVESVIGYNWDFNGEGQSFQKDTVFTFLTDGNKSVGLQAFIPGCTTSVYTEIIAIETGPNPLFSYSGNCEIGSSIQFTNESFGENITGYSWDFGDGVSTSMEENPVFNYLTGGQFNVELTVTNASACNSIFEDIIIVTDDPRADFSFSGETEGIEVEFNGLDQSPSGDSINLWQWNFDGLGTSSLQSPTYVFTNPDEYNISLQISTSQGCFEQIDKSITINEAKCPIASFSMPSSICLDEPMSIVNSSINAVSYEWDFCIGDILEPPSADTVETTGFVGTSSNFKIVENEGLWYGFAVSRSNIVSRISFGSDPSNLNPTIDDLTGVSDYVDSPEDIDFIETGGKWYAVISNFNNSNLTVLAFDSDLDTHPNDIYNLPITGITIDQNSGLDLIEDSGNLYAILANRGRNSVVLINFSSNFESILSAQEILVAGSNSLRDVTLFRDCSDWHLFTLSLNNNSIHHIIFQDSITAAPIQNVISLNGDALKDPRTIIGIKEGLENYLLISSAGGEFYRANLGENLSADTASVTDLTDLGVFGDMLGFDIARANGNIIGYGVGSTDQFLYQLSFSKECGVSQEVNDTEIPKGITFSEQGIYNLQLKTISANGGESIEVQQISISSNLAPDIAFDLDNNNCVLNQNTFLAINNSLDITTYSWDFTSDGIIDTAIANPSYQFDTAGTYTVRLDVEAANGCHNFTEEEITIYPPPPDPTFSIAESVFCDEAELHILNSTDETGYDDVLTYNWEIVELDSTFTGDEPTLFFDQEGQKIIRVFSSLPGCESDVVADTILVNPAPETVFDVNDNCLGEITTFQNLSETAPDYTWSFGDGFESTLQAPEHAYDQVGDYTVSLTVTDDIGCSNSFQQEVRISGQPVAGFQTSLICENEEVTFQDTSSVANADIIGWEWYVNDELVSTERNPTISFDGSGDFNVRQDVSSSGGCSIGVEQTVSVLPAPVPTFEIISACVGETFSFINTADPTTFFAAQWELDQDQFQGDTVQITFDEPGEYAMELMLTNVNLCSEMVSQAFTVYEAPVLDFEFFDTCENDFTIVADSSTFTDDPIIAREWLVNGETAGNGSQVIRSFNDSGLYDVTLLATTQSGCEYSLTQSVNILPSPVSEIGSESDFAVATTSLDFENLSNSDSVFWFVNDSLLKTGGDFTYQFSQEGVSDITLISINDIGCSDTVSTDILVAVPEVNLQLLDFQLEESEQFASVILDVRNSGNLPVEELDVVIELDNQIPLKEVINTRINIGESNIIRPNIEIPLSGFVGNVCVTVSSNFDSDDLDPFDNEQCIAIKPKVVFEPPFPNPASTELVLKSILPNDGKIEITLISLTGMVILNRKYKELDAGLNTFVLELDDVESGVYFLKVQSGGKIKTNRVVVSR